MVLKETNFGKKIFFGFIDEVFFGKIIDNFFKLQTEAWNWLKLHRIIIEILLKRFDLKGIDNWLKLKIRVMKITFGNCDNLSDSFFNSFSKEFQDRETLKLVF